MQTFFRFILENERDKKTIISCASSFLESVVFVIFHSQKNSLSEEQKILSLNYDIDERN